MDLPSNVIKFTFQSDDFVQLIEEAKGAVENMSETMAKSISDLNVAIRKAEEAAKKANEACVKANRAADEARSASRKFVQGRRV